MCAFNPNDSAIKLTPEQELEVSKMFPDQMTEYFRNLAVEQGLATRDYYSPDALIPTVNPQPKSFAKAVTINGKKFVLEAATEAELVQAETELYRQLLSAAPASETKTVEQTQARDESGRFVAQDDGTAVANDAELRLKMMRGEISVDEYITQSGALDSYMRENFGLDREAISGKKFEQDWATAVQQWLSGDGVEWPGGEANKKILTDIIAQNDLMGSEDKIEALNKAYQFARENNLLVPNPELEARRGIAGANSPEEIRAAAHRAIGVPENPESIYNVRWK
jgi:hypothetical protein